MDVSGVLLEVGRYSVRFLWEAFVSPRDWLFVTAVKNRMRLRLRLQLRCFFVSRSLVTARNPRTFNLVGWRNQQFSYDSPQSRIKFVGVRFCGQNARCHSSNVNSSFAVASINSSSGITQNPLNSKPSSNYYCFHRRRPGLAGHRPFCARGPP